MKPFFFFFLIKSISSDSRAIIVDGDKLPILLCEGNAFVLETTNIPIYSQQENMELEEPKMRAMQDVKGTLWSWTRLLFEEMEAGIDLMTIPMSGLTLCISS